jgi:hypothetical protein
MAGKMVLSEDEALELMAFLVTAARTQVDEAAGVLARAHAGARESSSMDGPGPSPRPRQRRCPEIRSVRG